MHICTDRGHELAPLSWRSGVEVADCKSRCLYSSGYQSTSARSARRFAYIEPFQKVVAFWVPIEMPSFSVSSYLPYNIHSRTNTYMQRLVRFLAKDGRTYYGDAILPKGVTDISKARQANIIRGQIFGKHDVTDEIMDIRLLLAPLALEDVKTVRCLGLNYEQHAIEVSILYQILDRSMLSKM